MQHPTLFPRTAIRPAARSEAEDVVAVLVAANEEYRSTLPAALFEQYLADLRNLPSRWDQVEVGVATLAGRIVGAVVFRRQASVPPLGSIPEHAGFRMLAVLPDARRRGIARCLVEWAISRADGYHLPALAVHSASFQHAAHALYRSLGFVRAPSLDFDAAVALGPDRGNVSVPLLGFRLDLRMSSVA